MINRYDTKPGGSYSVAVKIALKDSKLSAPADGRLYSTLYSALLPPPLRGGEPQLSASTRKTKKRRTLGRCCYWCPAVGPLPTFPTIALQSGHLITCVPVIRVPRGIPLYFESDKGTYVEINKVSGGQRPARQKGLM